jgi:polyphosphate kinase
VVDTVQGLPATEVANLQKDARLLDSSLYINQELSLLEFNRRVLAQARDPSLPLLERLRFLTICSTNLDEFFEIRVAGLIEQVELDVQSVGPDGLGPQATIRRISEVAHELVEQQYKVLNEDLLPALEAQRIRIGRRQEWTPELRAWLRAYFDEQVLPVLTPIALDPAHPFPNVLNKSLNFVVKLVGADAFGRNGGIAIVSVPRSLPRLIRIPEAISLESGGILGGHEFILLSSIVHAHIGRLFPGMTVVSAHQFRLTRNSDLWIDEEEMDDLLSALKGELPQRRYGQSVRLEVADNCTDEMADFLLARVALGRGDLYQVNGPVNVSRLVAVYDEVNRPDLKFPPAVPGLPPEMRNWTDRFEAIRAQDFLLHHPYQSFAPVLELLVAAAADPDVLAIKQTLYRTGSDSAIVAALIEAARSGKDVTVLIELLARFDEADNIKLATRLKEAGANVVYGVVGHKTHCKMMMILRRESGQIRRYVHLGTGNYHTRTARAYTDISLLTADPYIGADVHALFMQLTGLGRVADIKKLIQAPFHLHSRIRELIDNERVAAEQGRPARIIAKMNALTDPTLIQALYAASSAGVSIDLIVRGICRLRPGVPGVSENIRVRSVVGRFLEHSRIFYFHADGAERVFASSADWMERNLYRRVEAAFPIETPELKARVIRECLDTLLQDTCQAWELQQDGTYVRTHPEAPSAQAQLQSKLGG